MMRLLISLADFPDFVPFSVHIAEALVSPHIRDAQTFDVGPLLPVLTWQALVAALDGGPVAGWTEPALAALWSNGVRPLLVSESARRMLLWHGAHVTPNGLETVSDIGHAPVSGQQRAELRADLQAKCAHYRARLASALRTYAPTTTTSCNRPVRRPGSGGLSISAV